MLSPDGESDRFLIAKETKLVGHRRGKFVFYYVSLEASSSSQKPTKQNKFMDILNLSDSVEENKYRLKMIQANAASEPMMNLDRNDVLQLVSIASGPSREDLQRLLTFFTRRNPVVRFASLWRINSCNDSISIVARSGGDESENSEEHLDIGDYRPQLYSNGDGEQEFICESSCPSIANILSCKEFREGNRKDVSIRSIGIFDKFHPAKVVEKFKLDHFVALPITVKHQPDDEFPRFMCLLYCDHGRSSVEVVDEDIKLIHECVGNLIYNIFGNTRQATTAGLTQFLTRHHSQDEQPLLDYLIKECISCEAVFSVSKDQGPTKPLVVVPSMYNSLTLNQELAQKVWDISDAGYPIKLKSSDIPEGSGIRSVLVFQPGSSDEVEKSVFVFCNKKSTSPLVDDGVQFFINDFGFDDVELMADVGAHLKAFTETVAEEKRRNDLLRIVAHETKQPALDIWNAISSHRKFPNSTMFGVGKTLNVVEENAELSLALAEMNMDFGGSNIQLQTSPKCAPVDIKVLMLRFKNALKSFCNDSSFDSRKIEVDVGDTCRELRIQKSVVAAFFINMVTNSVKYNQRSFEDGWCSIRANWVHGEQDPIWRSLDFFDAKLKTGLLITVTDNGRGIAIDSIPRVFDRNFREHEHDGVRGLGLGLFRVAEIVRAYGGDIWVKSSQPSENVDRSSTTFGLVLPRTKVII